MPDPTPAEIEAGARVLDQWEHYVAADSAHVAELVLRAVLPDHDARIRAEVAEEIAQAIEVARGDRCPTCRGKAAAIKWERGQYVKSGRCGGGHAWRVRGNDFTADHAAIARAHATPPEETDRATLTGEDTA